MVPSYEQNNGENIYTVANIHDKDLNMKEVNNQWFSEKNIGNFLDNIIANKKHPCHQCVIFPICLGNCPKLWFEIRGGCLALKYNIKERMALSYLIQNKLIAADHS